MTKTAEIRTAQLRFSNLPLQRKKNWQAFCRHFQKTFDKKQSQTQAKIPKFFTRASGEQIRNISN